MVDFDESCIGNWCFVTKERTTEPTLNPGDILIVANVKPASDSESSARAELIVLEPHNIGHVRTFQEYFWSGGGSPDNDPVVAEFRKVESLIMKEASLTKGGIVRCSDEWRLLLEEDNDPDRLQALVTSTDADLVGQRVSTCPAARLSCNGQPA